MALEFCMAMQISTSFHVYGVPIMTPVTITRLRSSATVNLMTAASALGLGRTKAYELARRNEFPCRVIRIGDTYRIPTPGLLELLGASPEGSGRIP